GLFFPTAEEVVADVPFGEMVIADYPVVTTDVDAAVLPAAFRAVPEVISKRLLGLAFRCICSHGPRSFFDRSFRRQKSSHPSSAHACASSRPRGNNHSCHGGRSGVSAPLSSLAPVLAGAPATLSAPARQRLVAPPWAV